MRKGQIWISAVLYIAIGVVTIIVILSAGVPIITKLKDKNTIIQTKEIFIILDNVIREVRDEGPGAKRVLDPFIIKDGSFLIDAANNKIKWNLKTNTLFAEPCGKTFAECNTNNLIVKEGTLKIYQTKTIVEDEYILNLELDYAGVGFIVVKTETGKNSPLTGKYVLIIQNDGVNSNDGVNLPDIGISVN